MPSSINIPVYSDALVLLGTAGIVIPLVRRFGFNPVIGYLGAGAILGPLGLGSFIGQFPFLYWFTVVDAKNVAGLADLGIVFLLFLIGMELSYERLKTMRRLVFGLGSLQIVFSAAAIGAVAILAGGKPPVPLIVGACLALSSTALVLPIAGSSFITLSTTRCTMTSSFTSITFQPSASRRIPSSISRPATLPVAFAESPFVVTVIND